MRIALATVSARRVGGAESYLADVVSLLKRAGHEIALLCEFDGTSERPRIDVGSGSPTWTVAELGRAAALERLAQWRPQVIYSQTVSDPVLELRIAAVAPSVIFVHGYHGACISGGKTFKRPVAIPCDRTFGPLCLAHFYPHRCGGLSPITMWRDYQYQAARLKALRAYRRILTASEHMRTEYLKYGFPAERVRRVRLPLVDAAEIQPAASGDYFRDCDDGRTESPRLPSHVAFVGRMEYLKGGALLIDAISVAVAVLNRPLTITFAGDGAERAGWEERARAARARDSRLDFSFAGWLERGPVADLFERADLLALPSIWPEPFGLVGIEAGLRGTPTAAFRVGGISEWLTDGINGRLAPGDPPTALGLAAAIAKCLSDPAEHARLSRNARETALRFSGERHLEELSSILREAAGL